MGSEVNPEHEANIPAELAQDMSFMPLRERAMPVPHIGHRNHLCDMAEAGVVTLDQMKALVRDPKFICKKCGRVANKEENLCEPVPL